ncbi:MAG TPA: hypothetical protein VHD56_02195 [Tepidisphaeraceae bacterium]|nr:hypothetical protein [Tepidisphaeraceae bacterium]
MREDSAHFIDQSACPTRHMARTFVQFHGAYRQEFDPQISQMTDEHFQHAAGKAGENRALQNALQHKAVLPRTDKQAETDESHNPVTFQEIRDDATICDLVQKAGMGDTGPEHLVPISKPSIMS